MVVCPCPGPSITNRPHVMVLTDVMMLTCVLVLTRVMVLTHVMVLARFMVLPSVMVLARVMAVLTREGRSQEARWAYSPKGPLDF